MGSSWCTDVISSCTDPMCVVGNEEEMDVEEDEDEDEEGNEGGVMYGADLPPPDWEHFPGINFAENSLYNCIIAFS